MDNKGFDRDEPNTIVHRHSEKNPSSLVNGDTTKEKSIYGTVDKQPDDVVDLKQSIGFFSAVGLIMGSVIGSGIFVSPKGVLKYSGSVGLSLVIWVVCGVFSLVGCFAFAELGTLIPDSGGEYIFLLEAFSPNRREKKPRWFQGLIAFLFNWQSTFLTKPGSLAIQGMTCGEYIVRLGSVQCPDLIAFKSPTTAVKLIAVCLIMIIWLVNISSVKLATRLQNVFTSAKVFALIVVICGGILQLSRGHTQELQKGFEGSSFDFAHIASAFYSGMFAYAGWDSICMVTKEMQNPKKDLPLALITSMFLVMLIYLAVNVSYLTAMTTDELLASNAVAVSFGGRLAGYVGVMLIVASVACSTFGSANGGLFTSSRLCHVAAREGHMMKVLSFVHVRNLTPATAVTLTAMIAIMFVCSSEILTLISLFGFVDGIFMTFCMGSLLFMRQTRKHQHRTIKSPMICPVLYMLFSLFLVITPLVGNPTVGYLYVILFLLVGTAIYFIFVHFKLHLPGIDLLTRLFQVLFEVVPADTQLEAPK